MLGYVLFLGSFFFRETNGCKNATLIYPGCRHPLKRYCAHITVQRNDQTLVIQLMEKILQQSGGTKMFLTDIKQPLRTPRVVQDFSINSILHRPNLLYMQYITLGVVYFIYIVYSLHPLFIVMFYFQVRVYCKYNILYMLIVFCPQICCFVSTPVFKQPSRPDPFIAFWK